MIKFGTGGWRAVIGDDFTKANIQLLAQGLVNKMKSEGVTEHMTADFSPKKPCSGRQRYLQRHRSRHT